MAQRAWLIRAGRAGEREQWALANGVSGGGFQEIGDLSHSQSREDVVAAVRVALGEVKEGTILNIAAQLWALRERIAVGDLVVMPLKNSPALAIGRVTGPYHYRSEEADPSRRHVRPIEWVQVDVPRTAVKQDLLYSLGAFSTVCEVSRNDAAARVATLMSEGRDPGARASVEGPRRVASSDTEDSEPVESAVEIEQYASDRLASYVIETFAGPRMQNLVAAVLEAQGFTCKVAPEGPDQGVDILAGRGPLGLDEPRLIVQVKSEAKAVGSEVAQQLLGAMSHHRAEQGLLVAWGGVSRPAEQLLKSQYFRIRVWTSEDLLAAVFRNYSDLSEEIRKDLPLKQVWVLVEEPG